MCAYPPLLPIPANPKLLDGSAEDRKDYKRTEELRIYYRRLALLAEFNVDGRLYELACQMQDDPKRYLEASRLSKSLRFSEIKQRLSDIHREECAVFDEWLKRKLGCPQCKTGIRTFRNICDQCWHHGPSRPPKNGIRPALSRARQHKLPATLTTKQWQRTVKHFENRCAYCGGPWCLVEHATPLPPGGTTVANCLPACAGCNRSKGARSLEDLGQDAHVQKALAWLRHNGRSAGRPK